MHPSSSGWPARTLRRCLPFPGVERAGGRAREPDADFLTAHGAPRTVSDVLPRIRLSLAAAVASVALSGCGASAEQVVLNGATVTANTTRLVVQTAETGALALYRAEQIAAVDLVKAQNGTREQAEAAVLAVRTKWKPVWDAIDAATAAHTALVTAIGAYEQGKQAIADVSRAAVALATAEQAAVAAIEQAKGAR